MKAIFFFIWGIFGGILGRFSSGEYIYDFDVDCFGRKDEDSAFELITGFVFTAPQAIMDTKPGISSLEECVEICRRNDTCRSLNYETELCVLFSASAANEPDALSGSQYPVFTLYAQKICVRTARRVCPDRPWIFDRVSNYKLIDYAEEKSIALTREECMGKCLASKTCRSASFLPANGECFLSSSDRRTSHSPKSFSKSPGWEYMENNCVSGPDTSHCQFRGIPNRVLKTMDSVYYDVHSLKYCEKLCIESTFNCRSYDYGEAGDKICRLSHHTTSTLSNIASPYMEIPGATTFEQGACYDISVDCRGSYMIAKVRTNRMFKGKMYGKTRPNSCRVNVNNSMEFQLYLGFNDIGCDVKEIDPGRFVTDVVLQHHDTVVTNSDVGLKVRCNYNLINRTVSNSEHFSVDGKFEETAEAEQTVIRSPNVTMRITDRRRNDVTSAKVGDHLALTFRIEVDGEDHPYEIFVRELVAMDGVDSSEITLIDDIGCPTDTSIMNVVRKVNGSGQILQADFDAFKFPTSDLVQFRALVTPCIPRCDPVYCDFGYGHSTPSHGRRRKKRSSGDKNVLVGGKIKISDKFIPEDPDIEVEKLVKEPDRCLNALGAVIGGGIFLLTQITLITGVMYIYKGRKDSWRDEYPSRNQIGSSSRR